MSGRSQHGARPSAGEGVGKRAGKGAPPRAAGYVNTARDALLGAITAISAAGCPTPRLDAEILLADVLGVSRERLITDPGLTVAGPAVRAFQDAVRRRAVEREPVAYIIGRRGFRSLELAVDGRALVPRPETELLVEVGLELGQGLSVLDLGTGSGAVALALKHERPDLHLTGSDASGPALELARSNALRLRLEVRWVRSNMLAGLADDFDAILANLPYVAESERGRLAPEIVRHEPPQALFAGSDGLVAIRTLLGELPRYRRVRLVGLELGAGQAPAVLELVRQAGFATAASRSDLAGIERVVVGERPAAAAWSGAGRP